MNRGFGKSSKVIWITCFIFIVLMSPPIPKITAGKVLDNTKISPLENSDEFLIQDVFSNGSIYNLVFNPKNGSIRAQVQTDIPDSSKMVNESTTDFDVSVNIGAENIQWTISSGGTLIADIGVPAVKLTNKVYDESKIGNYISFYSKSMDTAYLFIYGYTSSLFSVKFYNAVQKNISSLDYFFENSIEKFQLYDDGKFLSYEDTTNQITRFLRYSGIALTPVANVTNQQVVAIDKNGNNFIVLEPDEVNSELKGIYIDVYTTLSVSKTTYYYNLNDINQLIVDAIPEGSNEDDSLFPYFSLVYFVPIILIYRKQNK